MSQELDANLTMDDLALRAGQLLVQIWMQGKKIAVLEARVDELDPPESRIPEPTMPANGG